MTFHRGKRGGAPSLDTVGVAGSTPVVRTKFPKLKSGEVVVIPSEYDVVPFLDWEGQKPQGRWLLTRKIRKTCEKPVNGKRRSRSA